MRCHKRLNVFIVDLDCFISDGSVSGLSSSAISSSSLPVCLPLSNVIRSVGAKSVSPCRMHCRLGCLFSISFRFVFIPVDCLFWNLLVCLFRHWLGLWFVCFDIGWVFFDHINLFAEPWCCLQKEDIWFLSSKPKWSMFAGEQVFIQICVYRVW